ncbi:MAG TPA: ankyrin repeat domain-containing protein, partial [Candidatus Obscuribacterales bacterium]
MKILAWIFMSLGMVFSLTLNAWAGPTEDLFQGIAAHDLALVQRAWQQGASQTLADDPKTALMHAAEAGDFEIFEYLLDYGADPGYICCDGWTTLMSAATGGNPEIFKL